MIFKLGDRVRWTPRDVTKGVLPELDKADVIGTIVLSHNKHTMVHFPGVPSRYRSGDRHNVSLLDLTLVVNWPMFKPGDRVVYDGPLVSLQGKAGLFKAYRFVTPGGGDCSDVIFDHEPAGRVRVVNTINLRQEPTMNIKQTVINTVKALDPRPAKRTALAILAYNLLVATSAATAAESLKKKAKEAAVKGGLVLAEYRPGEVTSFDDKEFTVVAKTKEPASRLDQEVLRAELSKAGLSKAKIDKAFVAATTENKPATSYEVIQK